MEVVHPDDLEGLAYHFGQAGDQEKARYYTVRAGDRARKLYANEEALSFYNDALRLTPDDHSDRFHILSSRSRVYDVLAQRENQRADTEAMLRLAESANDNTMLCDALIALANLFLVTENYFATEPAQRAVEIARNLQDPVREGLALRCVGWSAWNRHNYHESLSALETAVARFRQAGMLAQAAECLHMLSLVTGLQGFGEINVSQKYAEDAVQTSRLAGDPRQEAISLRRIAIVKMDEEKYEEALSIAQQALTLHRELGDRYEECNGLNAVAVMHASMGHHEKAREVFEQGFEMALSLGSTTGIWIIFANLEWFYYRREGLFEGGLAFAEALLNRPEIRKDPFLFTNILRQKAEILTELGQYPAAIDVLREALEMAERHTEPIVRAGIRFNIARLHADMGRFNEAQNVLEEARVLSRRFERPNDVAALLITEAEVARREWEAGNLKQIRKAASQIDQAVALLRSTPWSYDLALALTIATWVALAENEPERALERTTESRKLFEKYPVKPEGWDYAVACALWANGQDEEAYAALERAYQRVMQVAGAIQDEAIRKSWLEDVYYNRQIVNDWINYHGL
jgi:tetratricopeptide (TPR) repeat protein